MNDLLIGLLGALLATNQAAAASNVVKRATGLTVAVPDHNDPVEREYQRLLTDDDAAQAEVDGWIQAEQAGKNPIASATLRARVAQRFEPVKRAYENFLQRHPAHARAHLAYGSFLNDIHEETAAEAHWEKARALDPHNPAAWNNLANHYAHSGGITNSFACYARAIELNPTEPVYYQNFADTVFLFRQDAMGFYRLNEQQVFDKAMALYRRAQALDPENFILATEIAQTHYGLKPPKTGDAADDRKAFERAGDEALAAWRTALRLARDDIERQGVFIHFARWQIKLARFDDARASLAGITNRMFDLTKDRLRKNLETEAAKTSGAGVQP